LPVPNSKVRGKNARSRTLGEATVELFETEADFLRAVRLRVSGIIREDVAERIVLGMGLSEHEMHDNEPPGGGLNLRVGNWVMRDADIPVIEAIAMVGGAIVALATPGPLAVASLVAGLTAFAKLVWSTWRKSAKLSRDEIAIIGLLHVHGPIKLEGLQEQAERAFPHMSKDSVADNLLSLTEVQLIDGSIVEVARRDASSRWRLNSV
jgi:hypothetical protein